MNKITHHFYILLTITLLTTPFSFCHKNHTPENRSDICIMTFNIRRDGKEPKKEYKWYNRVSYIQELLHEQKPDILGLQEAGNNQINDIKNMLGNNYAWIGEGRQQGGIVGWFCPVDEHTPIFYNTRRFTLIDYDTFWLNPKKQKRKRAWGAWLNRICTWAKLKDVASQKIIWVFNTHLDHMSQQAKTEGLKLIINEINQRTHNHQEPAILMGDFNSDITPGLPIGNIVQNNTYKMFDVKKLATNVDGVNWTAFKDVWHGAHHTIDHLLINKPEFFSINRYVIPVRADNKRASDHNPVIVNLQLR